MMKPTLRAEDFHLAVHELRTGFLSDVYFWREKRILEEKEIRSSVTMQVFQRHQAILCGIDEALAVLRVATGYYRDYGRASHLFRHYRALQRRERALLHGSSEAYLDAAREQAEVSQELDALWVDAYSSLQIDTLSDGDAMSPLETAMHITGEPGHFAHLETIYLGILSRRTRTATNVRHAAEAANGKTLLFFPARFDHWSVQEGDGYAAHIGGAHAVSTDAQAALWGAQGAGTIPHALIAAVGGDTPKAATLFSECYPETNLIALVDFDNDCVETSLACARALGKRLWGVRLDTASRLVDKALQPVQYQFADPFGVVPELVVLTRKALDREGFEHVRIVVSGGFDAAKIGEFEKQGTPVDAYGVGSSLLRGSYDFTADIVLCDGRPCAKVGREYIANPRLSRVEDDRKA